MNNVTEMFLLFLDNQICFKNIVLDICNETTQNCKIIFFFQHSSIINIFYTIILVTYTYLLYV